MISFFPLGCILRLEGDGLYRGTDETAHGGNVVYQSVCFCLQHDIADCCPLTRSCHDRNTHCIAGELAE